MKNVYIMIVLVLVCQVLSAEPISLGNTNAEMEIVTVGDYVEIVVQQKQETRVQTLSFTLSGYPPFVFIRDDSQKNALSEYRFQRGDDSDHATYTSWQLGKDENGDLRPSDPVLQKVKPHPGALMMVYSVKRRLFAFYKKYSEEAIAVPDEVLVDDLIALMKLDMQHFYTQ